MQFIAYHHFRYAVYCISPFQVYSLLHITISGIQFIAYHHLRYAVDCISQFQVCILLHITISGMRFIASARSSRMSYVSISGAGLMDPSSVLYAPALKVDYHVHSLDHLVISDNSADGLVIMHNDVYSNARLTHSVVRNNTGNGITVRLVVLNVDLHVLKLVISMYIVGRGRKTWNECV